MRKIFLLFAIIGMSLCFSGCDKEKSLMFFSSQYLTRENFSIDKCDKEFKIGQRINFILYYPKPFTSKFLRLQLLKMDNKPPGYSSTIAQARYIEIDTTQHFAEDYFCLYTPGYYFLRVFSKDNLKTPIAQSDFWVKGY